MRRFAVFVLAFLLAFSPSVVAGAETVNTGAFYNQPVLKDLSSSLADGQAFDLSLYPYDSSMVTNKVPQIIPITLYEYSYGVENKSAGLYLYLYNPTNHEFTDNSRNMITLFYGNRGSEKYPLKILSYGGDGQGHDYLYMKCYVDIPPEMLLTESETRSYKVTEVELCLSPDAYNAHSYEVDCAWNYTGSVLDNTLSVSCEQLDIVVPFEINSCVYRIDDGSGKGTMHQIDSVYFAVPNYLFEEYNGINGVHVNYYEYDSGWLLGLYEEYEWVGMTFDHYNDYKPLEGVVLEEYDEDIGVLFAYGPNSPDQNYWIYNKPWWMSSDKYICNLLNYVFPLPEDVPSDTIIETNVKDYISEAWVKFNRGEEQHIFTGVKEEHLVNDWVWADELVEYDVYNPTFLEALKNLFSSSLHGVDLYSVPPIQVVNEEALKDIEGNLYVDSYYSSALTEAYEQAAASDCQLVLLHFAQSEYYSRSVNQKDTSIDWTQADVGFVARENVYMDFDILDLSFEGDGQNIIIPVAASPVNVVPPIQSPIDDGWPWWVYLLIALAVLLLLSPLFGGITVVVKVLLLPLRLVWWLLKALGKGIGALFRKRE